MIQVNQKSKKVYCQLSLTNKIYLLQLINTLTLPVDCRKMNYADVTYLLISFNKDFDYGFCPYRIYKKYYLSRVQSKSL